MSERKYLLAEIDRMRRAIAIGDEAGGSRRDIVFRREEMLRSYMMNGTDPEELEAVVEAKWRCPISEITVCVPYP